MEISFRNGLIFFIGLGAVILSAVVLLGPSFWAVTISFALAYLAYPAVEILERKGMSRHLSLALVSLFLLLMSFLLLMNIAPIVLSQARDLITSMPKILDNLLDFLKRGAQFFGIGVDIDFLRGKIFSKVSFGEHVFPFLRWLQGSLGSVAHVFSVGASFLLIPLFFVYWFDHVSEIRNQFLGLCPRSLRGTCQRVLVKSHEVLSGYFRGQALVAMSLSIMYSVGFTLVGVPFGLVLGIVAGLLSLAPYVGAFTAVIGSGILWAAFGANSVDYLKTAILISVIQAVESFILSPKIVGDKVGLSPLISLLALIIGANNFGFLGVFFALPVAGIIKVLLEEGFQAYKKSSFSL